MGPPLPLMLMLALPQGQALRSALHHFRCPLCQDVDTFQAEMFRLGIKIPDRLVPSLLPPSLSVMLRRIRSCLPGCQRGVPRTPGAERSPAPTGMLPGRRTGPSWTTTSGTAPATPASACARRDGRRWRRRGECWWPWSPQPQPGDDAFVSSSGQKWKLPGMPSRAWHRVRAGSSAPAAGGEQGGGGLSTAPGLAAHSSGAFGGSGSLCSPRPWRLLLCSSCGSRGTHQRCSSVGEGADSWECGDCSDTGTGEGCSRGDRVPRATWPPQPSGTWGQAPGCHPGREGGRHGLVVLTISLPLPVPPVAADADSSPPAQGPSHSAPAPATSAAEEEARILEGHPDTQPPS